jgi:arylsulfatase A-like enzyme
MALMLSIFSCSKVPFEQPNIVFIMSDDHSPNAISCYGNRDITTPGIDRLAREGIRFEHAMTPSSFCTPSRAMLLTGKYAHINGTTHLNQPFDGSQQTYPKLLQQAGYQTSIFGKWHLLTRPTGFDYYCLMKMQGSPYDPRVFEPEHEWIPWEGGTTEWNEGGRIIPGYGCDVLTDEALKWLENRDPSKPFCLLLHPKPPHEPYVPAKRHEGFLNGEELPEPESLLDDYEGRTPEAIKDIMTANRIVLKKQFFKHLTEEEQENWSEDQKTRKMFQGYLKDYYRLAMSVDDNVNKVLDFLRDHDLEKNTIVVYTTDNGFFLGEHGFFNKQWMYEPSLHVPLIIRYPVLIKEGTVNSSMVNHTDIAPTLLELAGLPVPADMQGKSLKPILSGEKAKVHEAFYYHFYEHGKRLPEMVGVRTERYKLISYPGMEPEYQWELFDLKVDRDEMNNLYRDPAHSMVVKEMREKLDSLLTALDDPVVLPDLETRMK